MKVYLLIILLFGACVKDKNETIVDSSLDQTTNEIEEPIIATYGIEPELFWIEKYNMDRIANGYINLSITTYYDPISNKYYYANLQKTNNIIYDTNNIQNEKPYVEYKTCWGYTDPLTYIGSIDFYHRAYINTNGQQYLKTLSEIDTSYYINSDLQKILTADHPLTPLITNLYYYHETDKQYVFTDGKTFYQLTDEGFIDLFRDKEHTCGE